jgi:hypothetical protein
MRSLAFENSVEETDGLDDVRPFVQHHTFGAPAPRVEAPPPNPTPSSSEKRTIKPDRQRRKRRPAQLRPETLLLSQWRSPTESLMRVPGEQLLKIIPRLNEFLIEINLIAPTQQKDQQN